MSGGLQNFGDKALIAYEELGWGLAISLVSGDPESGELATASGDADGISLQGRLDYADVWDEGEEFPLGCIPGQDYEAKVGTGGFTMGDDLMAVSDGFATAQSGATILAKAMETGTVGQTAIIRWKPKNPQGSAS